MTTNANISTTQRKALEDAEVRLNELVRIQGGFTEDQLRSILAGASVEEAMKNPTYWLTDIKLVDVKDAWFYP